LREIIALLPVLDIKTSRKSKRVDGKVIKEVKCYYCNTGDKQESISPEEYPLHEHSIL